MPRKILFLNTTFEHGGAAGFAVSLFNYFNDHGHDAHFAYGRGKEKSQNKTFKFGNPIETALHIFLVRFLGLEGYGTYFSTRKLIKYIQKEKFDLIHLHNLHGYYINYFYFIKFLNKANIPLVWTLHDEWSLTWLPAHSMGCEHCKTGVGVCTNTYSYPKTYNKIFLKIFLRKKQKALDSIRNLYIIPSAKWLGIEIQKSYLKNHNIQTIHNGIDTNIFKPVQNKTELRNKYNLPGNKKIILFIANNLKDKNKGVAHILKTALLLKDKNYLFLGIGQGNFPEMNNISILSYISDRKVLAELYSLADLFCITSRVETEPFTVLESFASGLPVIGFNIPALRDLILDSNNGELAPVDDDVALAKLIDTTLNNTEKYMEQSKNARNTAVSNFSDNISFNNYLAVYQKC